jgi:hypothetical protein
MEIREGRKESDREGRERRSERGGTGVWGGRKGLESPTVLLNGATTVVNSAL